MMEMRSNRSDDNENDLSPLPPNGSHLRPGTRVLHNQTLNNSTAGEIQRRRHVTAATGTDPHVDLTVQMNSKYTKRQNQKIRRWNKMMFFIIPPIVSCAVGFFRMLSSLETSSSTHLRHDNENIGSLNRRPGFSVSSTIFEKTNFETEANHMHKENLEQLEKSKNDPLNKTSNANSDAHYVETTSWKTFIDENDSRKSNSGTSKSYDPKKELYNIVYEDGGQEELSHNDVHILLEKAIEEAADDMNANDKVNDKDLNDDDNLNIRKSSYDSHGYVKSKKVDSSQTSQSQPQTVELQGWNSPTKFRTFPLSNNRWGVMKNIDPDYGDIAYESIRNEEDFARIIPEDRECIVPGGFDSNAILDLKFMKKKDKQMKEGKSKRHPTDRTEKFDPKGNDVSYDQLRQFYDDDGVRIANYYEGSDDDESRDNNEDIDEKRRQLGACRAVEWESSYYPTCNEFHSIDVSRPFDDPAEVPMPRPENSMMKVSYVSHGHYRDVFIIEDNPWIWPNEYMNEHHNHSNVKYDVLDEKVVQRIATAYRSAVLKTFNWKFRLNDEHRNMVSVEAVIMERLRKSPRIMDIYGHCGYSITAEVVPIEFEETVVYGEGFRSRKSVEKRNKNGLRPYNNFTAEEKLGFALTMAESLADLHGFSDGVIVHDDVQLCQWLRLPDGTMKLGDFNRATIMEYDVLNERYCKFNNGPAFGNYRAPEEFDVKDLDEKIDLFSFGNNIYAMLTGLWNFYDIEDDDVMHEELIDGKLPYVDPRWKERSYIERRLVELTEKCWIYDPDERVDIFYAVEFLRETVRENNRLNAKKIDQQHVE